MQNEKMAAVAATIDKSISIAAQKEGRVAILHSQIVDRISGELSRKGISAHTAIGFAAMVADDAMGMRDAIEAKGHDFEVSLRAGADSLIANAISHAMTVQNVVKSRKARNA